jgi:CHAT domain-containing protein
MRRQFGATCFILLAATHVQAEPSKSAEEILAEADRFAFLRLWAHAEPLFREAEKLFEQRGDVRNALYAKVGRIRGELPHRPVPEVSDELASYLNHPLAQSDDRLRLRILIVKGETDQDFDPVLSQSSWQEALDIAKRLNDPVWQNRASGELGVAAGLLGDTGQSVTLLGQAIKTAKANGDVGSQIRWLSIVGLGFIQFGRPEDAIPIFDRALALASHTEELRFYGLSYLGKASALIKLRRYDEASKLINDTLAIVRQKESASYQAELMKCAAQIEQARGRSSPAIEQYQEAAALARRSGANRILVDIDLELGKAQRDAKHLQDAGEPFAEGVDVARRMQDRLLLPRLLTQLAETEESQGRVDAAKAMLEEAWDDAEGLLAGAPSPWVKSRLIDVLNDVFVDRIRLEGTSPANPARMFSLIEQVRGRTLSELLLGDPMWRTPRGRTLAQGERELSALQKSLYSTHRAVERKAILDRIFTLEWEYSPAAADFFRRARGGGIRRQVRLAELQKKLGPTELLLEFALADPTSICLAITRDTAAIHQLPDKKTIDRATTDLLDALNNSKPLEAIGASLGASLLRSVPEIKSKQRLIIVPGGQLNRLPFELLSSRGNSRLLETHVVSYAASGTVLAILRSRPRPLREAATLAVSSSPEGKGVDPAGTAPVGSISRGVYDVQGGTLAPLPSADDEARAVDAALPSSRNVLLTGQRATESELKNIELSRFRVIHFAAHGLVSTKYPERSAVVLHPEPNSGEDGLLQAREILTMHLNADLVTLSACDTGSGRVFGEEGASSLVRPFLAAGARAVVANLWRADDTLSLALMKEFYRRLGEGQDKALALQQAKLALLRTYSNQAVPKLWSGLLLYGDGMGSVAGKN